MKTALPHPPRDPEMEAFEDEMRERDKAVDKPPHYSWHPTGVECYEITQHFSFWVGNAMKYLWRHNHKGKPLEDLKKARKCIDMEIQRMEDFDG